MAAAGDGKTMTYVPDSYEEAYYDGLFMAADPQRTGSIGGHQAVAFFSRSKLPMETLKNVWTVADNPPTNFLDKSKFSVALRLIQLIQNGQKGQGPNLAVNPGVVLRPVFLEGISGAHVPLPQQQSQGSATSQGPTNSGGSASTLTQQQQSNQSRVSQNNPPPAQVQTTLQQPAVQHQPQEKPVQSMALTAQDPFTMTPSEQGRYEAIFPQYAQPDGFMYGKEAVELFSKSGLSHQQLRDIWNMADSPVDNKLDKFEFAIAMHLIVCVSKKNLSLPHVLPMSLKALKQQQIKEQQTVQQQPEQINATTEQVSSMSSHVQPANQPAEVQPTAQRPPSMQSMQHPPTTDNLQPRHEPPSVVAAGGMNISDAFEGLSVTSGAVSSFEEQSKRSYGMAVPSEGVSLPTGSHVPPQGPPPAVGSDISPLPSVQENTSAQVQAYRVVEKPKSTEQLRDSYAMSDSTSELEKLKVVLQKLQAENISLKAQLNSMTEEEKDVQKETNAVITEIGKLSNELTSLRAEVLASKSRLVEASLNLKVAHEKKGVINDLVSEVRATKEAIDGAYSGIEASTNAVRAPQPAPAPVAENVFEGDLFGFDAAPGPPPDPTHYVQENGGTMYAGTQQPHAPSYGQPPVQQPPMQQPPMHLNIDDQSSSTTSSDLDDPPEPSAVAPSAMQMAPGEYGTENAAVTLEGYEMGNPTYGQQVVPNPAIEKQPHNRAASISSVMSFTKEGIMGGAPIPISSGVPAGGQQIPDKTLPDQSVPTVKDIDELKKRAKEADDIARDAAESHRQLMAQADELRRVASVAEKEARDKSSHAEGKKGGMLGRSKKKNKKEIAKAQNDAAEKKKKYEEIQSQANDAQAVAMETKREAEKLRKQAEQAELEAAAAASMHEAQKAAAVEAQKANNFQAPSEPGTSYDYNQPVGYPPQVPSGLAQHPPVMGGHGMHTGVINNYNQPVMGGIPGGTIPSPHNGDMYGNPFE